MFKVFYFLTPADFAGCQQEVEKLCSMGIKMYKITIGKCVLDKRKCTTMVNNLASGNIEIGCSIDI